MIAMAMILLAAAEGALTVTAVRLGAEGDGLVVRVAVSGPVAARVERDGRELLLILPGARPAAGMVLPEPVAEIQSLAVEEIPEGARMRLRLESALPYELRSEPGLLSLSLRPLRPIPPPRRPESVRDLYAKILPPPFGADPAAVAPPAGERAPEGDVPTEGLHLGPFRVLPSLITSYVDADTALLDTPAPVRDRYFQIEPRVTVDVGDASAEGRRLQLSYTPRFRVNSSFGDVRRATHLATASLSAAIGPTVTIRASHHYANGVLETTEIDPGREYFFDLSPFTRHDTQAGVTLSSGGLMGLDLVAARNSVHVADEGAFFDHRVDTVASSLTYQFGTVSRAYLRYQWEHLPAPAERPIAQSTSSGVVVGLSGELLPLLTGELAAGLRSQSAPRAGAGGTRFRGATFLANLRKEFTPTAAASLVARRGTYPSSFEQNAFYVSTGFGAEASFGLPLTLVFHAAIGWQRNTYQVVATGLSVPRQDDLLGWSAGVGRSLTRWSFLRADYRQDRRDSNLPAFATDGRSFLIQFGLGYLGQSTAGVVPR
jgi:hypothetical protein